MAGAGIDLAGQGVPDGGFEIGFDEGFGNGNLPVWLNNRT